MNRPRKRLLTFNDPQPLRIDRRLAIEVGFLESVVLLQLEFLISITHNEREGQFWTYHTLKQLKERHFPWLSQATICRTLQNLEDKGLIQRGNFNRSGFDRTQWFALNYAGIAQLNSVMIGEDAPILHSAKPMLQVAISTLQDATPLLQPETSLLHDEATIPETTPERIPENNDTEPAPAVDIPTDQQPEGQGEVVALTGLLTDMGVSRRKAERLVRDQPAENVTRQIAMLQYRKADDPAAVLVRAIEEDWAPPAEYRAAETARTQDERRRQRRDEKAREDSAKAAADEARRDIQDAYWLALPEGEQEVILAQSEATLRANSPFLFTNGVPRKTGLMYQTMLEAERRTILEQRLADGRDEGGTL